MALFGHLSTLPSVQKSALVVGNEPDLAAEVSANLPSWKVERVASNRDAREAVETRPFDLIVTGEDTSGKADVELLRDIRRVWPHTRLIILTNETTPADVIDSIRPIFTFFFCRNASPGN